MDNGITKKGIFNLTVEPYLKPISDIGVGFYNLDENTATLRFNLYNTKGPLLIGENNLSVYGYFESSNGSVSDVVDLEIVDEMNGVVEVTLDQEFLHASTSTEVKGQLYIGVRNVDGKPEYNEVAVLGEFTFEIADALINKISSFTKIEYIRMFSQLKAIIKQDVVDIKEAIKNGADYVAEMKTVKSQAITQINQTVTEGKLYIDKTIAQAQNNINNTATSAISDVNNAKDNAISTMNIKVNESVDEIKDTSTGAISQVNAKMTEFNNIVDNEGFVKPAGLDGKLNSLTWQKSKLTKDDGRLQQLNGLDFSNPDETLGNVTQFVYVAGTSNYVGNSNGTVMYLVVTADYKRLEFRPNMTNKIFIKEKIAGTWSDWKEVTKTQTNTGWLPLTLKNGAAQIDGNYPQSTYRVIDFGTHKEIDLRLSVSNITENSVIAFIPQIFTGNEFHNFQGITNNQSAMPRIAINKIGDITFSTNPTGVWSTSDILVVETSWRI